MIEHANKAHSDALSKKAKNGQTTMETFSPGKLLDHHSGGCHCHSWGRPDSIMCDTLMATAICTGTLPVNVVENPFLKLAFGFSAGYKYQLPGRTWMRSIIADQSAEVSEALEADLRQASGVSLCSDGWSANHKTFFAITATYLDDDYKMRSVVVDLHQFEESHGAAVIQKSLKKTLDDININLANVVSLVGDACYTQQAGMREAWMKMQLVVSADSPDNWCRCLAHMLQTAIRTAEQKADPFTQPLLEAVTDAKLIANAFGRSSIAHDALIKAVGEWRKLAQGNDDEEAILMYRAHTVIADCVTRWDGVLMLHRRFLRLINPIRSALVDLAERDVGDSVKALVACDRLMHKTTGKLYLLKSLVVLYGELQLYTKAAQVSAVSSGSMYYYTWISILQLELPDEVPEVQRMLQHIKDQIKRLEPGLFDSSVALLEPALLTMYLTPLAWSQMDELVKMRHDSRVKARELVVQTAKRLGMPEEEPTVRPAPARAAVASTPDAVGGCDLCTMLLSKALHSEHRGGCCCTVARQPDSAREAGDADGRVRDGVAQAQERRHLGVLGAASRALA